jgi:hypothetical protein
MVMVVAFMCIILKLFNYSTLCALLNAQVMHILATVRTNTVNMSIKKSLNIGWPDIIDANGRLMYNPLRIS